MSRSATKVERQPKLFFVSTSATTTTLQTASVCYSTSGAPTAACTGRRKRSINIEGVPLADVKPSQLNQEVQSSQEDQLDREGRFLLYWITTTSVSTSTSFTTTVSISGKVICTTSGIVGVNVCGKWFWWSPPPCATWLSWTYMRISSCLLFVQLRFVLRQSDCFLIKKFLKWFGTDMKTRLNTA